MKMAIVDEQVEVPQEVFAEHAAHLTGDGCRVVGAEQFLSAVLDELHAWLRHPPSAGMCGPLADRFPSDNDGVKDSELFKLWELVRGDVAKAEFIEAAVSQLMQLVYHVVMAALKVLIDSGRLLYAQFEGSLQVIPARSVRERYKSIETWRRTRRNVGEGHGQRTARKVVGTQIPDELNVEGANRSVLVCASRYSVDWVNPRFGVRAITQVYRGEPKVVSWTLPHRHGLIQPVQEKNERIM